MPTVYLNGRFLPEQDACVSVLDRGFIFGDGVYEVIPVYHGKPFRLAEHLERLGNSLAAVRIAQPMDARGWETMLSELIAHNGGGNLSIYLHITRGVAKRDHAFPNAATPTVFAMANPLQPLPESITSNGVAAITLDDTRWRNCHIKAISLLPNILLRQEALDHGAAEAILIRDGIATEGAASNVFIVSRGTVITPPKGPLLLPGITRDLVLELAQQNGIPCAERDISEAELRGADEIWVTSSTREIVPITRLDDAAVSGGKPGPMWQRLYRLYQDYKTSLRGNAP